MKADWVRTWLDTLEHNQRRLQEAQQEACRSWLAAFDPARPMAVQDRLDDSLQAGASLWQAQADVQRDWMQVTERFMYDVNRTLLARIEDSPYRTPSTDAVKQALLIGQASCGALSRASRQVGHFATTRFSAAAVGAARDARRAWRRGH